MKELVNKDFEGLAISFTNDGWFNATEVAKRFGGRPIDWTKQVETKEYIQQLCEIHKVRENHFVKTVRGTKTPGTWFHPKLAVPFARWLDVKFSIWCDQQIDLLIRGELDVKKARHKLASTNKAVNSMLQMVRDKQGKETKVYHYANEAKLVNWALTGCFTKLDRDSLTGDEMDCLALLEEKNTLMLAAGLEYNTRKTELERANKLLIAQEL